MDNWLFLTEFEKVIITTNTVLNLLLPPVDFISQYIKEYNSNRIIQLVKVYFELKIVSITTIKQISVNQVIPVIDNSKIYSKEDLIDACKSILWDYIHDSSKLQGTSFYGGISTFIKSYKETNIDTWVNNKLT